MINFSSNSSDFLLINRIIDKYNSFTTGFDADAVEFHIKQIYAANQEIPPAKVIIVDSPLSALYGIAKLNGVHSAGIKSYPRVSESVRREWEKHRDTLETLTPGFLLNAEFVKRNKIKVKSECQGAVSTFSDYIFALAFDYAYRYHVPVNNACLKNLVFGDSDLASLQNGRRYIKGISSSTMAEKFAVNSMFYTIAGKQETRRELYHESVIQLFNMVHSAFFFENICIVTKKPQFILVDTDGNLHCEDSPAVIFNDFYGLSFWRGVNLPNYYITHKENLQWKTVIESEKDEVLKKVFIDIWGREDWFRETSMEIIHTTSEGCIWKEKQAQCPITCLVLKFGNNYQSQVNFIPKSLKTVDSALAWMYNLTPKAYENVITGMFSKIVTQHQYQESFI